MKASELATLIHNHIVEHELSRIPIYQDMEGNIFQSKMKLQTNCLFNNSVCLHLYVQLGCSTLF
jgi:hypothetical protein